MRQRKFVYLGVVGLLASVGLIAAPSQTGASVTSGLHPATGVGSCTLKGWHPSTDPKDATDLPEGHRPQTYVPDNYNCTGAKFAANGAEFAKFPQPHNFSAAALKALNTKAKTEGATASVPAINPLAPYFPPFKHFVILYRENHTFDDYLGDCATTIAPDCNGKVMSPNHISDVPNLHTLAKTYALGDSYSTGTQPPSGPNHWWLFSAQSSSSSQQQSYPTKGGTIFDRLLKGVTGPPGEGTNPCATQTGSATGTSPFTFVMNGDFYWMLNSGSGEWRNPGTGKPEVLPVDRPGTTIPDELTYNNYTCNGQNDDDQTIGDGFTNFVTKYGLPTYSYVELFNDHPGTYQDIPKNDAVTKQIVDSIMGNASYKNNTLIIVTEDDTQNGNNGPDHVSNTYRVPLVVIGSPTYVKQGYISHVAYTTNNVLAAMERVEENVHPGIIDPNDNLGLGTYPMTTADQAALGDPLEDFWIQGSTPLSASASASPTTGNAPLAVSFKGTATGGTGPYTYKWNFGDGSAAGTKQNPTHTYASACTCKAKLTVTDSSSPAKTATSTVTVNVSGAGSPLSASATGTPTSGQVPLAVDFTGIGAGGSPPYTYKWKFGDGTTGSTAQNPTHTYTTAGKYTATLTVTDSASSTATSTVSLTASPIGGTAPGPPRGLTATAGNGQVSLSWQAPANNGGVAIKSYKVYRGTTSGGETLVTSAGCSSLGAVLKCTDSGLTNGKAYFYRVSAVNSIGEGAQSAETSATPSGGSCTAQQLLGNRGFETGTPAPWLATTGVVSNNSTEPPRTGSWKAWLDGYGTTHTDTLSQQVTLPAGCTTYQFAFWMHIDTAETTTTTKYDTLKLQLLDPSGTVLRNMYTYSNLNHNTGYSKHSFNLSAFAGQTVTLKFTGAEDSIDQTSFVLDDTSVNVS